MTTKTNENNDALTFEQAYERLEKIVQEMESGNLKLDELEAKFEEGMKMVSFCSRRLENIEVKVNRLIEKNQGELDREPFDLDEEEG